MKRNRSMERTEISHIKKHASLEERESSENGASSSTPWNISYILFTLCSKLQVCRQKSMADCIRPGLRKLIIPSVSLLHLPEKHRHFKEKVITSLMLYIPISHYVAFFFLFVFKVVTQLSNWTLVLWTRYMLIFLKWLKSLLRPLY